MKVKIFNTGFEKKKKKLWLNITEYLISKMSKCTLK